MSDDAQDWADLVQAETGDTLEQPIRDFTKENHDKQLESKGKDKKEPGAPTQYSLYRDGYTTATPTVSSLPAGSYDIMYDGRAIYASPVPDPTGLLLELPEMKSEAVIKAVELFWDSEKDYKDGNDFVVGGAAYKAGVMLYGPPGSGKSCTIKIVSKKLIEKGGIVFHTQSPQMTMSFLKDFAKIEKDRKIIVILEDIDSLIYMHGESSFLEMLDSAKSVDNVLFIATTNYPEKLDQRIYNRPGRFSTVIKIDYPTPEARAAYLKAVLKNHKDVEHIVNNTSGFTVDHLSALINAVYREKKDLDPEIKRLRTLFKAPLIEEERKISLGGGK